MNRPTILTRGRTALMALLATLVGVTTNLQATPAHAADVNAIDGSTITLINETRQNQEIRVNDNLRIEANWSIPDQTGHAGDTFSLDLPEALRGRAGSFTLTPEGQDAPVYGNCDVQQTKVVCTLTDEVEGKSNVRGRLWFASRAETEHTGSNLTFTLNGNTPVTVPLPKGAQGIGYDPYVPQEMSKLGYFIDDDTLTWRIIIPGNVLAGQQSLHIHDPYGNPGTNFTVEGGWFYKVPKTPKCWNSLYDPACRTELWSKEGASTPGTQVNYDDDIDKIVANVNGPFEENAIYTLHLDLKVEGTVVPGSEFENAATVNGQAVKATATKEAAGGGTGQGDAVGHIQLAKRLEGANTIPADTVFPVKFSFERAGQPVTGTVDLKADGTPVVIRNIVNGTVVTLTEELPKVQGHTFGDPVFSGGDVVDGGANSASATVTAQGTKTLELVLTNPVEPPPALEKVAPVSPQVTPGVCIPGSTTRSEPNVDAPTTPGITYGDPEITVQGDKVTITMTATPEAGKELDAANLPPNWTMRPDGSAVYSATLDHPACPATEVVPVDPTFAVGVCQPGEVDPTDPTITAADTEGIDYATSWAIDGDEVVFEAIATAKPGYVINQNNLPAGWTWNNTEGTAVFTKREAQKKCAELVVPVSPTVKPGVCTPGAATPSEPTITVADTEGITYSAPEITKNGRNITVKVTATRKDGFIINGDPAALPEGWVYNNDGTATFTTTVEQPECAKLVAPVSPTLKAGVCEPDATEATRPSVELATTEGISYSSPAVNLKPGSTTVYEVIVTARPQDGYQLANLPDGWTMNADGVSANYVGEVTNPVCDKAAAPVSPAVTPGVCIAGSATPSDPSVEVPTTDNVTYGAPQINGNTVTLTATPAQGYVFSADTLPQGWALNPDGTATFTQVVDQPKCDNPAAPVSPTVKPGVCTPGSTTPSAPTVEVATTDNVTYGDPKIEGNTVTVDAIPAQGYVFSADTLPTGWKLNANGSATFTQVVDQPKCDNPAAPVSPTVKPGVCTPGSTTPSDPSVEVPTTEGIDYSKPELTVEGQMVSVKVIATAALGHVIDGANLPQGWVLNADGTATFTTTVEQPKCELPPTPPAPMDPVKPVDPKVTPGVCKPGSNTPTPPRVELPKVPGLVYGTPTMKIVGGKVKITVTVTPEAGKKIGDLGKGWTLNADGTATFTYMGNNPVCTKPGLPKTGS